MVLRRLVYPGPVPTAYDLTQEQLTDHLAAWGEPAFRAKQVYAQLWKRSARYEEMSDVSPALRDRLVHELPLGVEVLDERLADGGATRKSLLKLGAKGHIVEVVLMGYAQRVTVCISSQVGCGMDCGFCATGQMGLMANLTAGEIAAQVVWARREAAHLPETTPQRLTNVVFMGMGEPIGGCLLPRSPNTSSGLLTMTSFDQHSWDTEPDGRSRWGNRPSCSRRRDGWVREEHVLASAVGEDRLAGDTSRRPLLEAGMGQAVERRLAGDAT